jgi:hypothetical protein
MRLIDFLFKTTYLCSDVKFNEFAGTYILQSTYNIVPDPKDSHTDPEPQMIVLTFRLRNSLFFL